MSIGERLKFVRGSTSQHEFSKKLGVSKAAVGAYERNAQVPGSTFVIAVCESCDVEHRWLLTGQGPMRPGHENVCSPSGGLILATASNAEAAGSARYLKLEEKLNRIELQRDGAMEQLRQALDENRRLWRQSADLRERLARLEERSTMMSESALLSEHAG